MRGSPHSSHSPQAKTRAKVLIIGAGPAGSATALRLAQLGVDDVTIVDLHPFPRHKTCGSGLSPRAIQTLQQLGVWSNVEPISYPISGLRLVTPGGHETYLSAGDAAQAAICLRHDLDHEMHKCALAGGVSFVPGFAASEPIEHNRRWIGVRARDGREILADWVVVANGAHTRFSTCDGPKRTIHTIMGWWEHVGYRAHTLEMIWDPLTLPYYGWLFPETSTRVNIGITYEDGLDRKNARDLFDQFLDKHYAARLCGATQIGKWKGHPIVYTYRTGPLSSPGRVIVGEAGRMTHPATGEGISQAMRSGIYAAEAIAEVQAGATSERAALARYERRCANSFLPSFWAGGLFRSVLRTPLLDYVVKAKNMPLVEAATARMLAHM
ncbi:NAD(P)/FAD-dependent oxidoreductase [Enhygromyxa salina]|uniref:Putative oxidoreductase n=1 Tax=Enhygromyxa salina TaxID=215803 RepID=A0A2S9YY38_9BACT|nr:NAD(P)/FAD-dependent oxidoreductase [Enhygromyxa salina]PRQ09994.1 putative oxidoreductase [Enhygromyxa salina]